MKKYLKYLSAFWGLSLCLLPASHAQDLTFDEALSVLISSNEAILASQMEINERDHELLAAKGLDYPRIQAGARYTALNDPIIIDLSDIRTVMLGLHPNVPPQLIPSFESSVSGSVLLESRRIRDMARLYRRPDHCGKTGRGSQAGRIPGKTAQHGIWPDQRTDPSVLRAPTC